MVPAFRSVPAVAVSVTRLFNAVSVVRAVIITRADGAKMIAQTRKSMSAATVSYTHLETIAGITSTPLCLSPLAREDWRARVDRCYQLILVKSLLISAAVRHLKVGSIAVIHQYTGRYMLHHCSRPEHHMSRSPKGYCRVFDNEFESSLHVQIGFLQSKLHHRLPPCLLYTSRCV